MMELNILTWNLNRNNHLDDKVYEQLLADHYHIICLQEVDNINLLRIKEKLANYLVFSAKEILYSFSKQREYYLVTLLNKNFINRILTARNLPLRSVVSPLYRVLNRAIDIEYTQIVFSLDNKEITLVNCHLQYACSPKVRENQLASILHEIETEYFILAGDLNTFSKYPISLFIGLVFGYSKSDYRLNERDFILENSNFNSGKKLSTTIYCTGKLDWVLLSKNMKCLNEYILPRFGSDHFPLVMECEI